MKKIHNIIQSELVVRTNNIKFRQEYGDVGVSSNLRNEGNTTIFTTEFGIDRIISLTVNGVNLIEGVHYFVDSEFEIYISNSGNPLKSFSGQETTVLVVYMRNNNKQGYMFSRVPPIISTFYLNKYEGRADKIVFDFAIDKRDGENIYWSILKDGGEVPLFSGSGLFTNNGFIVDSSGNLVELAYYVSNAEYLDKIGDDLNFTLVVVYDLTEDGTHLDEKLLASTKFRLLGYEPITGNVASTPAFIGTIGTYPIEVSYSLLNPNMDVYNWRLTKRTAGGAEVILDSGTTSLDISDVYLDSITALDGDAFSTRYYLMVKAPNETTYREIDTDRTSVDIPVQAIQAKAGYLDENLMNYYDTSNVLRKIGYSGSAQDVVEYNNRVPAAIFTKAVDITMIDSGAYVTAPVHNPTGTIRKVYFVIEVPQAWGAIKFFQPTGEVPLTSFNIINLGNGFDAYLYELASSSSTNPSDYTIKR